MPLCLLPFVQRVVAFFIFPLVYHLMIDKSEPLAHPGLLALLPPTVVKVRLWLNMPGPLSLLPCQRLLEKTVVHVDGEALEGRSEPLERRPDATVIIVAKLDGEVYGDGRVGGESREMGVEAIAHTLESSPPLQVLPSESSLDGRIN